MNQQRISMSSLKSQLSSVLDTVSESGRPVLVTKSGKPVARLVPVDNETPLKGSARFLARGGSGAARPNPTVARRRVNRRKRR